MFIIYQPKIIYKYEGSYFYKNQKYRQLEKENKNFSIVWFQKFLIFPIWAFLENAQCFLGALLSE